MKDLNKIENNQPTSRTLNCDAIPSFCYRSLNRCNLPANILGSYTYQKHPVALYLDCVIELHADFFNNIKTIASASERSLHFRQYMCSAFLLNHSDEVGFDPQNKTKSRHKVDYLRLLRGWMFNCDGIEGAVMKRWVESRFGLLTLNHGGLLATSSDAPQEKGRNKGTFENLTSQDHNLIEQHYQCDYTNGLYNTNALESQLDLLYTYCQFELERVEVENTCLEAAGIKNTGINSARDKNAKVKSAARKHWQLYRGVNNIAKHTKIEKTDTNGQLLLLNNLSSFTSDPHLCESFGDIILEVCVPTPKILFFPDLLKGVLEGESEYIVIGGVYQTKISL